MPNPFAALAASDDEEDVEAEEVIDADAAGCTVVATTGSHQQGPNEESEDDPEGAIGCSLTPWRANHTIVTTAEEPFTREELESCIKVVQALAGNLDLFQSPEVASAIDHSAFSPVVRPSSSDADHPETAATN